MPNFTLSKNNKGFSIIELMVAMVLGLLILGGAISMLSTNKRIYSTQEMMSRLQENARFGTEILIRDIRMAGYSGCSDSISDVLNHVNGASDDDDMFNFENAVEGSESAGNWQPSNSSGGVSDIVANTDAISVRYLNPLGISISSPMPNVSAELKVTSVGNLQDGDVIAVSDCDSADIMQLTAVQTASSHLQHNTGTGTPGNATKNLQKKYGTDAQVVNFISRRYYIGTGANGGPSLFRTHNEGTPVELIEGVEQMQLLYGVDTSGNQIANTYVDAATVSSWDNVVSVRLSLLYRTVEENHRIDADTATHTLLGGTGNGGITVSNVGDNRRRRVFTTTIQIRNRST